jgi:hypothetical protein
MKLLTLTIALASLSAPTFAATCPSPKLVKQAFTAGFQRFDTRGNRLDDDPIAMIRSAKIMSVFDKSTPKIWKIPSDMNSQPEWQFNITLKRGIFGDGEVTFKGSSVTYGGQVSCRYDFSEVSGLGVKAVTITGAKAACAPKTSKNWKVKIPAGKNAAKIAASCNSGSTAGCQIACTK